MRRSPAPLLVGVALLVGSAACGQDVTGVSTLLPTTPAEVGLDTLLLDQLVTDIRVGRYRDIHSLLIVRNGRLALEQYFNGGTEDSPHTLQSVSKSVASALVGIAIADGVLEGVDDRVVDFFPQWREELFRHEWRVQQRLEDILTMRTGTDYVEGFPGSPHDQLNALSTGWDRFWLSRRMTHEPGTYWQYDSGGVITLSSIIKARTGAHADVFAESRLFGPLGIRDVRWFRNSEGHPHLGGGLYLRSRDMARFGQLYLQKGRWGDRQVVPEAWVEASFSRHVVFDQPKGRYVGYGYLWWILPPDPGGAGQQPIFAAVGFRGQHIFVIPEHDMVVVVTAGAQTGPDMNRPVEFLYSDILPAVL